MKLFIAVGIGLAFVSGQVRAEPDFSPAMACYATAASLAAKYDLADGTDDTRRDQYFREALLHKATAEAEAEAAHLPYGVDIDMGIFIALLIDQSVTWSRLAELYEQQCVHRLRPSR